MGLVRSHQGLLQTQCAIRNSLPCRLLRSGSLPRRPAFAEQEVLPEACEEEMVQTRDVWDKVNGQIADKSHGRLFFVAMMAEHQHKLTSGDLFMVNNDVGASIGQRIKLDKILLLGSKDFTLIGRPFLPRDLVSVEATVVEKNLSHTKLIYFFYNKRRHRTNFRRDYTTTLRINSVELLKPVNETMDRAGFEKPYNKDPLNVY